MFAPSDNLQRDHGDSRISWTVIGAEIEANDLDLKAVNPNAKIEQETSTPSELLDIIEAREKEVSDSIVRLRELTKRGKAIVGENGR